MPLTERDRKTIRIGAIVAGCMIVLVLGLNFLGRGSDSNTIALPSISVPTATSTTAVPTGSGGPTGTPGTPTHSPTNVFTGRDPFSLPAVFQATSTTSGGSSTSSSSGTSTSTSTSSSTGTSTSTSSSTSGATSHPTQPGNGSATTVGGHDVVLLDTFTVNGVDTVQVEVDGTVYNVAEGDTFGPGNTFELLSVSGGCGAFVFGDQSFTLCTSPQK